MIPASLREDFEKLEKLLADFKVTLVVGPLQDGDACCPFDNHLAIRFPDTLVLDSSFNVEVSDEVVGHAIHELGHLLVARDVKSDEFCFLGWEFAIAERYDLLPVWYDSMQDYGTPAGDDFGRLSIDEQTELLEERVAYAQQQGYLQAPYFPKGS